MIKLVLSDVDGTLIPLGNERVSERTMQAIRTAQEAGVRVGVATGRDLAELTKLFGGDDTAFRTGILSNGKRLMVDGEVARLSLINNDLLKRIVDLVRPYQGTFATAYPLNSDETNPVYCMGATEDELTMWSERYAFKGILVDEVPDIQILGATIACPLGDEVMAEIIARGKELCPEFDFALPAPNWCDILPKGINKGSALLAILDLLDVSVDEVAVFGDADNDLALLGAVENAVAVANATPSAKAAAKWHIGACADEAVADALEDIAQAAQTGELPRFMQN